VAFSNTENTANQGGICGEATVTNPANASWTPIIGQLIGDSASVAPARIAFSGVRLNTSGVVDAIRFMFSAGNIASGTIACYRQRVG
jgi:hypothetical protein